MPTANTEKHPIAHLPLFLLGIAVAVVIARSHVAVQLAGYSQLAAALVALVTGVLYSSVFTIATATVVFVQLAAAGVSIPLLALCGGIGGMFADLSMFQIIRSTVLDDVMRYAQRHTQGLFSRFTHFHWFRLLMVVVGALIIATPLPDEIGLALMGLGKARWRVVAILSLILNIIGIALIGLAAAQ